MTGTTTWFSSSWRRLAKAAATALIRGQVRCIIFWAPDGHAAPGALRSSQRRRKAAKVLGKMLVNRRRTPAAIARRTVGAVARSGGRDAILVRPVQLQRSAMADSVDGEFVDAAVRHDDYPRQRRAAADQRQPVGQPG